MNTAARTISFLALLGCAFVTTVEASEEAAASHPLTLPRMQAPENRSVEGAPISSAESAWAAIRTCAAIHDDELRHACTDDVFRAAGLMQPLEVARRKDFGLQRSAVAAVPSAGASAPATQQREKDQLEVTLAAVEKRGDGKLVFTTADGAIWQQVESEPIRPIPEQGQTMTITKGSLGSYLCKPGKWVAFRCARAL